VKPGVSGKAVGMRAVSITAPGGPDVLTVLDRPVRAPGPGEVRVAVAAGAVNPTDIALREGGHERVPTASCPATA
jgi:NADPH:quinone reductase